MTRTINITIQLTVFQSTHPYRVWRIQSELLIRMKCFNPHTHTGCDWSFESTLSPVRCFNPHTHTGCDVCRRTRFVTFSVSIHTPIQGVTNCQGWVLYLSMFQSTHPYRVWQDWARSFPVFLKFQSTHPYRVWLLPALLCPNLWCFNPHTHTGCDYCLLFCVPIFDVSIHTPIQGVTIVLLQLSSLAQFQSTHPYRVWQPSAKRRLTDSGFQSTHPYRVWLLLLNLLDSVFRFQSTHPYRVWQVTTEFVSLHICFNPHTHTGCDVVTVPNFESPACFNPHTHTGCDILAVSKVSYS